MNPNNASDKSGIPDHPPVYQADMGYPPAQGVAPSQGGYPPAQGYGVAPYGAQPYGAQPYGAQQFPGQATVTVQPTVYVSPMSNHVPDYLGYSIFTLLCCCLPLGIAALIYSINTRDANLTGNRDLAQKNSHVARLLNNIALGLGIVVYVITIILIIVSFTAAAKMYNYN